MFTRIRLQQSVTGSPESIEWTGKFDTKTGDASIDVITQGTAEPMAGTVALVGGQAMLTKDLKLPGGYEIGALDAPVLSMRLVMIVLTRAFPQGPVQIAGTTNVDRTDQVGIRYATPSASGRIPAPWHVKGKVIRLSGDSVDFDLVLTFPSGRENNETINYSIGLRGELGVLKGLVFRDDDPLDGWTTYGLGPQKSKQGSATILDYGAKPHEASPYRSIGDIRSYIAALNDPGTRDSTKDFTGFWKEECEQAFGLQIKHYGNEGKYSVVFCGPGGCGDPSKSRLTFITGDKSYEVVSEDELIEIDRDGDRQTYHRCSRDTNPVLERR